MQPHELISLRRHSQIAGRQEVYDEFLRMVKEMREVKQVPDQASYSPGMGLLLEHLVTEIKQRLS